MRKRRKLLWALLLLAGCLLLGPFVQSRAVVPVLMYHHVGYQTREPLLNVSPETFRRQMEFLKTHRYHFLSLDELVMHTIQKRPIPSKVVLITFDDGYEDNYLYAFPVLKRLGFPATFFIVADYVGKRHEDLVYMTPEELRELKNGGMEVGSHSLNHAFLPDIPLDEAKKQIVESKRNLEELLGEEVSFFSYPGGGLTPQIQKLVKEAGYAGAVALHPSGKFSKQDIFAIPRMRISESSSNLFLFWIKVSGFSRFFKDLLKSDPRNY